MVELVYHQGTLNVVEHIKVVMPDVAKADEDQVQDLSYNELRARLPHQ